ncbi:MAG: DUF3095 family protein [Bdellovibrionales bacterium]
MSTTEDFYHNLVALKRLTDMVDPHSYHDLPEDWVLVLTDVKGSTKAIEAGRYKEVNMVGVSCIIAAQNVMGEKHFPFIFGGDGATFAIPPGVRAKVESAMSLTRKVSREEFSLDLRIAVIPVRQIRGQGEELKVAKIQLSTTQDLAVLRGRGWMVAESWMKDRETEFNLPETAKPEGTMVGLECRWNPLPARKHEIMALIVQARRPGLGAFEAYQEILDEIFKPDRKPISLDVLKFPWPPRYLRQEAQLKVTRGISRWVYLLKMGFKTLAISLLMNFRGRRKNLDQPYEYLRELTENTDYLKFDETLRMVLDVSEDEKRELLESLERRYQAGEIFYGHHCDPAALLTCFVRGPHQHIHFVDAAGGGYAMAAKQLKSQRKAAQV